MVGRLKTRQVLKTEEPQGQINSTRTAAAAAAFHVSGRSAIPDLSDSLVADNDPH